MKYSILIFFILIYSSNLLSLDIEKTIKSTVENNIKIKIGLEEINESKELIESAYGNFRPDISLELTEKQSSTESTTDGTTTTTNKLSDTYSLIIKQNVYSAGRNNLELEKSKILFNKQVEDFYITLNQLIMNAIEGYLTVQLYEKSLDVTEKNHEVIKKIYEDTMSKKSLGIATLSDLKNAESSFETSKTNLITAQGDLEIGIETFKQVVGLEPISLKEFTKTEHSINYKDLIENAFLHNHDLKILNYENEISKIDLLIYENIKLPSLDLTGDISYNDNISAKGTETTSGSISAKLKIPIYQKGIENSDIRKHKSKLIQSSYRIDDKKKDIELNASILLKTYKINKSEVDSSVSQIEANKISLEVVKKEYEAGIKTFTDLIDQEEKLLDAYLYNLNKNKDLYITYFEILALQGKLIEIFNDYIPKI